MKKSFLLILFCLFTLVVFSQQKEMSIEDAIMGRYTYLSPSHPTSVQWKNDQTYVYIENNTLWQNQINKDEPEILLLIDDLNKATNSTDTIFKSFPSFSFLNEDEMLIEKSQQLYIFNLNEEAFSLIYEIPENAENTDFNSSTKQLAYTIGNNLYILDENGNHQITSDSNEDIIYGQSVHRNEFGIEKGTFWSSTGKYLAFYRKDESMVENYPLVNYMEREAVGSTIKYPMAGMTSHQVTIGIYDTETGEINYLNTGTPDDHYLTNISWGPNDEYIYIAELNRGQDHLQMNQYSVKTGEKTKTLFEETISTYVEPQHPIVFSKTNPDQFYYWSRKDGWFQIYKYDTGGELISQITKGDWEVTAFYGTDDKEKYLYYQSTQESPIERHIYKVEIETGEIQKLSSQAGTHSASFSPDMSMFIDNWESSDVPGVIDIIKTNGKFIRTIHKNENTLADYKLGENKLFTIKAADNETDLYCRMILPNDFDPSKKYPVVVYVYGGPHVQLITSSWTNGVNWWQYYMASQGYIAFTVDSRGSDARGQAFEESTFRQLGVIETEDQMKGIEYLKNQPYVDADRIGVHGWSFGGFMTLNLMLREPETFKVGVAGGPVVDWKMYEIMYGERYMDTPDENPEGYEQTNMLNHIENLEGKLMLIHGTQDNVVVMQHSMQFLRECITEGKQVDFFTYPTHPHNVRGKDRIHLMEKVSQYFFDYL